MAIAYLVCLSLWGYAELLERTRRFAFSPRTAPVLVYGQICQATSLVQGCYSYCIPLTELTQVQKAVCADAQ